MRKIRFVIYSLAVASCLIEGCVSNKSIKEFTGTSIEATRRLPVLADDLAESCVRQKQYASIREGTFDPVKLRHDAEKECVSLKASEKNFIVANKVLVQYLHTLDKLAGDDIVTYDKSIDKLVANLGDSKLIPKAQVTTLSKLVNLIGDASSNGWRRKKLGKAITLANPDIQTLLSTLSAIIKNDYVQLLQNEQLAAKNLYLATIKENVKKEPITIILLQQQWDREFKLLEERKIAAGTYADILTTIAQGHQLLFDKQARLSGKEVRKEILDYTSKLVPLIGEIHDKF
ncbi:hypothetical protein [Spirosoma radiotolerans]|uniref:Lipoprotein n=1 Tax=Spirosoma radiotolerans TaxID=1379870 RepID=A0A0E3ZX17_9BACT|nr:hypothetical protein [Spirosoma radiotolerans]AKD56109.1 hypothetical protein SD10_15600 [Spirosoma radiotolerans]